MNHLTTGADDEKDRISDLPDEILHDILARLRSPKQAAKATVLSSRWKQLWRTYPILEFDTSDFRSKPSVEGFRAAVLNKFFRDDGSNTPILEAARIRFGRYRVPQNTHKFLGSWVDDLLALAAKKSPREFQITDAASYIDYYEAIDNNRYFDRIPTLTRNNNKSDDYDDRGGLQVLELRGFRFDHFLNLIITQNNPNSPVQGRLGSSLREIRLFRVKLANDDERVLNSIIAGASLCLENFTLVSSSGRGLWPSLTFRNVPKLKAIQIRNGRGLEIIGAPSLEVLWFGTASGSLEVSSAPNLKFIHIHGSMSNFTDKELNKLIAESPSLESLTLVGLCRIHELKIANNSKLREVFLNSWGPSGPDPSGVRPPLDVIEIDAPKLRSFHYHGTAAGFPATIRYNKPRSCNEEPGQSVAAASFYFELNGHIDAHEWRSILATLSRFPSTLDFTYAYGEDICKQFMRNISMNHCHSTCKCWRHHLKEIRIIKRVASGVIIIGEEDEAIDVSTNVLSSLDQQGQISFILTWH